MKAHTSESQATLTPSKAYEFLKQGNERFVNNLRYNRNLLQQVNETREGQWPFAVILSCIDSRTGAELVFDQGLGDIFSIRIAGNIVNDDILGSMEFACNVANSKLLVVLGHSNCGAIKGACGGVKMGHLTGLLEKIGPAISATKEEKPELKPTDQEFVDSVTTHNVNLVIEQVISKSEIIRTMLEHGKIGVVGGVYKVEDGKVNFFKELFKA